MKINEQLNDLQQHLESVDFEDLKAISHIEYGISYESQEQMDRDEIIAEVIRLEAAALTH